MDLKNFKNKFLRTEGRSLPFSLCSGILILIFLFSNIFFVGSPAYSAARTRNTKNSRNTQNSKSAKNAKEKKENKETKENKILNSQDLTSTSDPDLKKERDIGRKAVEQIEKEWPVISDPAITSRLEMVLSKLEPFMKRRIDWELRLVKTEALNAFCLPGGYIFFTTGIIDLLKTDSEIAAVMAHEMIHADRKHSLRMAAKSNKITVAALAAMILSGGAAVPVILAQVAQVAITSGYTMEFETEADDLGLDALIASGYSPTAMVTLFEKFMNEDLKQPIRGYGIYMNHPETPERLRRAIKKLNDRGIKIERKHSLGLLRTAIKEEKGKTELTIDGFPVVSGNTTPEIRTSLTRIRENLDKYLQLELAPYEIHLVNGALYIKNNFTAGSLKGITPPETIRKNLLKVLNTARGKHPTASFFK